MRRLRQLWQRLLWLLLRLSAEDVCGGGGGSCVEVEGEAEKVVDVHDRGGSVGDGAQRLNGLPGADEHWKPG